MAESVEDRIRRLEAELAARQQELSRLKTIEAEVESRRRDMERLTRVHTSLTKRNRIIERLHPCFDRPREIEGNLAKVVEVLMDELDCEAGSALLIDGEAREFYFAAARGPRSEELVGVHFPVDKGLAGACARARQPLAVSDVARDPRFYREISASVGFEVRSILALPMRDGPGVTGVLELLNKRKDSDFRADEIETGLRAADLGARLVALGLELGQDTRA